MDNSSQWKQALAKRGIQVWVADKVARRAQGVILDTVIDRLIEYRKSSLRLFNEGNLEASYWAAVAMQDRAIEMDIAIEEKTQTIAGRKLVAKATEANREKSQAASTLHAEWRKSAAQLWNKPQHASKSASEISSPAGCFKGLPSALRFLPLRRSLSLLAISLACSSLRASPRAR